MAEINIYVAESDVSIGDSEYLGFFGEDGFGDALVLGEFNGRTFITDSTGSTESYECDNNKLTIAGSWSGVGGASGVIVGQTGSGIALRNLPNYLATINVRFAHAENVLVQNAEFTAFNSSDPTQSPIGINFYGAEIIHTSRLQNNTGIGDETWLLLQGSSVPLNLVDSPATSGLSPSGPASLDTRHDWYVALSATPRTPGDKTFNFQVSLEYI